MLAVSSSATRPSSKELRRSSKAFILAMAISSYSDLARTWRFVGKIVNSWACKV